MQKWILLFNKIILPVSTLIDDRLEQLLDIILNNVNLGPK